MKEFLQEFLDVPTAQLRGIIVLTIVLALMICTLLYLHNNNIETVSDISKYESEIQEFLERGKSQLKDSKELSQNNIQREMFLFDPNTIGYQELLNLGISDKLSNTIINYRNKGGRFYYKKDLLRIYGFDSILYNEIQPYIRIKEKEQTSIFLVDINEADASEFSKLKGIGKILSERIVKYRRALRGFYSISQIGEVYGLSDSTFFQIEQYLKLRNNSALKKLNINRLSINELRKHPYFNNGVAEKIMGAREREGAFSSLDDMRNKAALSESEYSKIIHYLSLGD